MGKLFRFLTALVLGIASVVGTAFPSFAIPITYSEQAAATGSLGGVGFTNANVVLTMTNDTTQVTQVSGGPAVFRNLGTLTVNVAGIGTATFTDSTQIASNQGVQAAGFGDIGQSLAILFTESPSFSTYDLKTSIGPVLGAALFNPGQSFPTTGGNFVLNSVAASVTFTATSSAVGCSTLQTHCTDGRFNGHNGGSPTSNGPEWAGRNVSQTFFPAVGQAGGAFLYVEQLGDRLSLMYDYVNSPSVFGAQPAFFDVFFQVPSNGEDYVVRIVGDAFQAFEKPLGVVSPVTADGSFDLGSPVWSLLGADELALADFHGAVGRGPSPNSAIDHLLAEFDLTINRQPAGLPPTGFYSPEPAFWSASVGLGAGDPPISSAIFTLNPDGTTQVTPVFGPGGAPAQQPQDVVTAVPMPSSLLLLAAAMVSLGWRARRRSRRAVSV